MKRLLLLFVLLISFIGTAQNDTLFEKATVAYNEGNYDAALDNYHKIIATGEHSSSLYFNLGNTYYKKNEIAPSIYYYEKALLLNPTDAEIKNNLSYAKNMTLDAIEELPKTGLSELYDNIIGFLSFDQWAKVAIGFMLLFVLAYIGFYLLRYATQKRIAFITSIAALLISICTVVFAFLEYYNFKADNPAIVFAKESVIKSEPNTRSSETFRLHEGTKVNVLEALDDWRKIQLTDGKIGWVLVDEIKILKDF